MEQRPLLTWKQTHLKERRQPARVKTIEAVLVSGYPRMLLVTEKIKRILTEKLVLFFLYKVSLLVCSRFSYFLVYTFTLDLMLALFLFTNSM